MHPLYATGSKLTITEEFQAKTDCSCTAWNRVNGVETRAKREVSLMIGELTSYILQQDVLKFQLLFFSLPHNTAFFN